MTEHLHTIDRIVNQRVLIVSFTGSTPHLETSLEISNRLANFNSIDYLHLGTFVDRPTLFPSNIIKRKLQLPVRINRAKNYIDSLAISCKSVRWLDGKHFTSSAFNYIANVFLNSLDSELENLSNLRDLQFDQYNIGMGVASTLISHLKDSDPFPLNSSTKFEIKKLIESSIISILMAKEIFSKKYLYDSVILLNGRFACERSFMQVLNEHQVKIYFHECGPPYPLNHFFFEDYMPQDFIKRNQEISKMMRKLDSYSISKIGSEFFKRKVSGDGVSELSYVANQAANLSPSLLEKIINHRKLNKKIVSYFTSSDDEFDFVDPKVLRYPNFINQINAVLEIAKTVNELGFLFIVRVHPNLANKSDEEKSRWELLRQKIKDFNFIWIAEDCLEPTYELIKFTDIVITSGSTVGIESIFLETPSIVIADCYYNKSVSSVITCKSKDQLKKLLVDSNSYLKPRQSDSFVYGAWAMDFPPRFKFFNHTCRGNGLMTDGSRIASPGVIQRIVSLIK